MILIYVRKKGERVLGRLLGERYRSLFLLGIILILSSAASAQVDSASVSGVITDQSGGLVAGAEVQVSNSDTNVTFKTTSNQSGVYLVTGLKPGRYRVKVGKEGFKAIDLTDLVLNIQDSVNRNFALQIGSMSETISVEANSLSIDMSGAVSTVVDQTYVSNMPLNGRSFQDLILLTPGVVTQTPQLGGVSQLGKTGEFSVNGQRPESNYYTVDGVGANLGAAPGFVMEGGAGASGSVPAATALGTTQALVSVDDLQEFRVQSSTYSAEYGRNPGGQFALETKSGANQWHGTAYDYVRNGFFDANDWFNDYLSVKEPSLRQNDFGGTLGGPIRIPHLYNGKDRTFFFVSYEGLRLAQPQAAKVNFVPDATLRTNTPAPLQQVLNAFPIPNGTDDAANGIAEFDSSWSNPSSLDSTSVRLDHSVNDRFRAFFRFSDTPSISKFRHGGNFASPTENESLRYTSRTYTAGVGSTLTKQITNEFRLNYSSNQVASVLAIDAFGGSTPVNLAQLSALGPTAQPSLLFIYGGHQLGMQQFQSSAAQRQWNVVDTAALSLGRHQLKFGMDYRRLTPVATPFNPQVIYFYLGQSAIKANTAAFAIANSLAPAYPLYTNFSGFAQDEWKASQRLTLSLGLRWEVNPAPGVTQGLKPYTVEGTNPSTYTLAPQGTALWKTRWANFAPRLGAAYIVGDSVSHETVLRGGAGIFYDTGQQLGSSGFLGPGYSSRAVHPGAQFPLSATAASPVIVNPPVAPYGIVYAFPSDLEVPYTLQWNVSIEQAFGKSQALIVSYVGARADRLLEQKQIDGATAGNTNISTLIYTQNGLTSDYNALQLQFQRKLSRGLTALASYTFSHCSDYGSQNYFSPYQRGNCDFDVRHNFSGAFSYDLPNAGNSGFMNAVLHHWGLDSRFTARTGFPITLVGNQNPDPATGQYYSQGLDRVPGKPVYIYGSQCAALYSNGKGCPGGWALNPNAFSPPTGNALGNAPRNFARGFGAWQMDFAIRRDFPIYERLKLQFRTEAFNIFNHPNFGTINAAPYCSPDPTSPSFSQGCTFGQATGTLATTLGILSPLYQMGGSRSMQFTLKFTF